MTKQHSIIGGHPKIRNGNTPLPESRQLENLKRLIDYDDPRFIPLIMEHSHVNGFNDLEKYS